MDASDKATTAFIRRTLCSQNGAGDPGRLTPRPIEELLPPLTSSNEVDLQLYGFIAVIIKEFVYSWYSKITPDHTFVDEVIRIIAHCTRALEQRLREVDLESLLLDEIPDLIDAHVTAVRIANESADSHPYSAEAKQVYHTLNPHPALSPAPAAANPETVREQERNEEAWRHLLVQGVLAVLLPTEDLENRCLHALVSESLAEMILGNGVSGRACEGWVLWEGITKSIEAAKSRSTISKETKRRARSLSSLGRLERFGLLPSEAAEKKHPIAATNRKSLSGSISSWLWLAAQYLFLAVTVLRGTIIALATSSSLPARGAAAAKIPSIYVAHGEILSSKSDGGIPAPLRPIVSMKAWSCFANLIELKDRMPWLGGFMAMLHAGVVDGPGRVGFTDGTLDRILSDRIQTVLRDPSLPPMLLRNARSALFPNNSLPPARAVPSIDEQLVIRRKCAAAINDLIPPLVSTMYFAKAEDSPKGSGNIRNVPEEQTDPAVDAIEEILKVFGDTYMNKHLIFGVIELAVIRLLPEMAELGVEGLTAERLGEV